ncbi:hypothetical protein BJ973_000115 [Actinoplanes tereljensis]|uniref:Uncharacterized protein n=1 Tax=Paractinoplanes tereljensis TaxID=571912 RepID=A0A919P033_9ACTN|nr:hypothetical protein Ate02nite_95220 [Actinoplanes tereljensis]
MLPAHSRDTGVVDQHVEATETLVDQPGGGGHAGVVGHIKGDPERVHAVRAQLGHRLIAPLFVAGADADNVTGGAEAGRDLVSDSLVGAGDQRNRLLAHLPIVTGNDAGTNTAWAAHRYLRSIDAG